MADEEVKDQAEEAAQDESAEEAEGGEDAGAEGEAGAQAEEQPEALTAEEFQKKLDEAKAAVLDIRMRSQAELENFKKRLEREHSDHLKYASEKVMKDLVPTLDNLELAITYGSKSEVCEDMMKGIVMTQKLLLEACGRHGLSVVGKEGEPFDPALHEAVMTEDRADLEPGTVSRVMQSGYQLEGRILRPAKVVVNKP
ncbi:MAG: nucleotide exchange factor GrpE [Desulfovibrio sp.]|nr:nucleotide exchange factor GrpE [Desulfovibrio sp.]MBR4746432.1 nucleotide exchange factor GrpE [Desulfovibrio sp.]MBR5049929.1 nucleotide exchange factor GrpE [Desulfovibrio sp.]